MGGVKLPNVKQIGSYLYFRRKVAGKDVYHRLPDLTDPAFQARYAELSADHTTERPAPGSIAGLVAQWRHSPEALASNRAEATRRNQEYALAWICDPANKIAGRPYATLDTPSAYRLRDRLAETPGKANQVLAMLRQLMEYARKRGLVAHNPVAGVERLELAEHQPWPEHLITKALAKAGPMTRLAIITGLATGQRIGDCITLRHNDIADGLLTIEQAKTGKTVHVPVHPEWRAAIDALPRKAITILYDRSGAPFKETERLQRTIRALMVNIGAEGHSFHGLRKNAANWLAELELTPHQIAAVTGMSLGMAEHYTKGIQARNLARGVAERMAGAKVIPMTIDQAKGAQG